MKSKHLIAAILEADPTGEAECCVGNCDIFSVHALPAYYDGCLQVLIRDPALAPYYDVVGGKYVGSGTKIQISTHSIHTAIFDHEDMPVTYEGMSAEQISSYEESIARQRKLTNDIRNGSNRDHFVKHICQIYQDFEDFDRELLEEINRLRT